jgi:Zn finger protein HypA/HybF involved in hydrogenase expression
MHEVGITQDFFEAVHKQISLRSDVKRVVKMDVRLGKALGISEDVMRFWFDHFAKGTKLSGAQLNVVLVDGKTLDVGALDVE